MTKRKKNEEERLANLFYDYKQSELFERSNTFEQIENECHRAMKIATRNYNEILVRFYRISNKFMPFFCQANEAKIRADERKIRQTEEQLADIANSTFSDILTENSKNILDYRSHILVDRWKGMNKDQLDDIRYQQLTQIDEHQVHTFPYAHSCFTYLMFQKIKNKKKYFNELWGQYENAVAKQGIITEQQMKEDNRQFCYYLSNENKNLAKIQREHQDYLNSIVYRSVPTAAFYQQFNTTSR